MKKIKLLNQLNDVPILSVLDKKFLSYGRVVKGYDVSGLISYMKVHTPIPDSGNIYIASDEEMEKDPVVKTFSTVFYGGMPIQAGYCNGRNDTYNGFEYHKSSEINVAVTDFMLVLGHSGDIRYGVDGSLSYDVSQAEVFYIPEGTVLEMYGDTLHLSPLKTSDDGFKGVVILQRGVNSELEENERKERDLLMEKGDLEAKLLLKRSKWVICHPEREPLVKQGAYTGVTGPNKRIYYKEEK